MKNKIIILLSVVATLFMACNEWEQMVALPLSEKPSSGRVVLIEEFTGAKCPNCPAGTKALEAIADKYPDNVVVVGVHSNFLANPAVTGDPKLSYPEAQDVENYLGAWLGKPEAAFNRKKFTNQSNIRIGKPDTWIVYVEEELKLIPAANLLISRKYSDATRELTIELKTIAKQNSSNGNIPNYNQKHVLRKVITPIPGDKIADNLVSGQEVIKEYKYTLPTDAVLWKSENCSVVAFLSFDESNKTILQAAEIKVK